MVNQIKIPHPLHRCLELGYSATGTTAVRNDIEYIFADKYKSSRRDHLSVQALFGTDTALAVGDRALKIGPGVVGSPVA